jgi:hypothetical protein
VGKHPKIGYLVGLVMCPGCSHEMNGWIDFLGPYWARGMMQHCLGAVLVLLTRPQVTTNTGQAQDKDGFEGDSENDSMARAQRRIFYLPTTGLYTAAHIKPCRDTLGTWSVPWALQQTAVSRGTSPPLVGTRPEARLFFWWCWYLVEVNVGSSPKQAHEPQFCQNNLQEDHCC